MFKKLSAAALVIYATISASSSLYPKFTYRYEVIAPDDSAYGMIQLYHAKQHVVEVYQEQIMDKDTSLHQHLIIQNIETFASFDGKAVYKDGAIIVTLGDGKGPKLDGQFKTSPCDASTSNNRIFILEWLEHLWS